MSDGMRISGQINFWDYVAFNWYHQTHSTAGRVGLLVGVLAAIVLGVSVGLRGAEPEDTLFAQSLLIVVLILLILAVELLIGLACFSSNMLWARFSKMNRTLFSERHLDVSEKGLTVTSAYGRSELSWPIVQKSARTNNHLFLYTQQHAAIVISRRQFENKDAWDQFCSYVIQRATENRKSSEQPSHGRSVAPG